MKYIEFIFLQEEKIAFGLASMRKTCSIAKNQFEDLKWINIDASNDLGNKALEYFLYQEYTFTNTVVDECQIF